MSKNILGDNEEKLCHMLKKFVKEKEDIVGIMLMLSAERSKSESNCKQLIDFLETNSEISNEGILSKVDEILNN